MDYFFYGSLRDFGVLNAVLGYSAREALPKRLSAEDGWLRGYGTRRVKGEDYPLLVPRRGGLLPGLVLRGLREADIQRIRFFEDAHYEPQELEILLGEGTLLCNAFLSFDDEEDSGMPWSYDDWDDYERRIFRLSTEFFMAHYGKTTFAEADAQWDSYAQRARAIVDGEKCHAPLARYRMG